MTIEAMLENASLISPRTCSFAALSIVCSCCPRTKPGRQKNANPLELQIERVARDEVAWGRSSPQAASDDHRVIAGFFDGGRYVDQWSAAWAPKECDDLMSARLVTTTRARDHSACACVVKLVVSIFTPGPCVVEMVTDRMYVPLAVAGLSLSSISSNAVRLDASWSVLNDALPIGVWMMPAFSTRNSTRPALSSRTALATSAVTVPTLGLGIRPRGPRMRPILPTWTIMSGVATSVSNSNQFSSEIFLMYSSEPAKSAPASRASF